MDFSDLLSNYKRDKTLLLPIDDLSPNPMQPRRRFEIEELRSLSESIKNFGVIQPVAVKKCEPLPCPTEKRTSKYEIIAGERRWRAAKMAGLARIPCTIFEADREDSAMMALIENLQRSDLSYFEEAVAMHTLLLMTGKTQSELATLLSISQSALSNKLRLLRLSDRERLMALENGFSERHCRALVRIESEKDRRHFMIKIINERLQSFEVEKLIDDFLSQGKTKEEAKKPKTKNQHVKGYIKDMRFFYNTVDNAVKLLHNSGYNASWSKEENDNGYEVKIQIKKAT